MHPRHFLYTQDFDKLEFLAIMDLIGMLKGADRSCGTTVKSNGT
jgi:hypothetical protein